MRQKTKLDEKQITLIERLAADQCTCREIAYYLDIDEETIHKNKFYSQIFEKGRQNGRRKLKRVMFKAALKGNIQMQIWLSKQILGYSEKTITGNDTDSQLVLSYRLPDKTDSTAPTNNNSSISLQTEYKVMESANEET